MFTQEEGGGRLMNLLYEGLQPIKLALIYIIQLICDLGKKYKSKKTPGNRVGRQSVSVENFSFAPKLVKSINSLTFSAIFFFLTLNGGW